MNAINNTTAISEAVSEKLGRGRPPAFPEEYLCQLIAIFGYRTRRTLLNQAYQGIAIAALEGHFGFRWILDPQAMLKGRLKCFRPTVLAELGRLRDPSTIRTVARYLLRDRWRGEVRTTRDAALWVRGVRQRIGAAWRSRTGGGAA